MSGFVAVVNTDGAPVDRGLLARLTVAMAFRGPAAQRVRADGPVGLGHALLATVDDYPEVPQPYSPDGQVWLAGDVRVDGRADLVAALAAHADARVLADASDPELVLHAYRAWGEGCVEHLIGDFAFAVWDGARRRLFCARDQMGVRPIYYARTARALVVSNTLDAVRLHPDVSDELDEGTIADFLLFGEAVDPTRTGFAGVERLAAAHTLTWNGGAPRTARYWTLPIEPPVRFRRDQEYVERFADVLHTAVVDRLRTDRVGVLMSGGLDSSSVAAVARNARPHAELRAYTTVYDELIPDQERRFAGRVADHLRIPIQYTVADRHAPYDDAPEYPMRAPTPAHHPFWVHEMAQYALGARRGRVLLTGQGGDAAFLPWPGQLVEQIRRFQWSTAGRDVWRAVRDTRSHVPKLSFRTAMARRLRPQQTLHPTDVRWPSWAHPDLVARYEPATRRSASSGSTGPVHPYKLTAYENLVDPFWDLLLETRDSGVTRSAVDVRHPLLDVRVLRCVLTLPSLPYCVEKQVVRAATRGALPEDVRLRAKAPLAGDPMLIKLRGHHASLDASFQPAPDLARFVRVEHIPTFEQIARQPSALWTDTRPYSLSRWLHERGTGVRSTTDASHSLAFA